MSRYPEHLRNFDYTGLHRYFLTFCTLERRPYFRDACDVALVLDQFLRAAARERFAFIAYCFMPDHFHVLAAGKDLGAELKPFIKISKQLSAYYFKQRNSVALWQRYGYEHVLRSDEETFHVVKYIVENPVRAGMVGDPSEYPFWGSTEYSREELLECIRAA